MCSGSIQDADRVLDFDSDHKQAFASRLKHFKDLEAKKTLTAGMHLSFPGIGHIHADGADTYTWVPIQY